MAYSDQITDMEKGPEGMRTGENLVAGSPLDSATDEPTSSEHDATLDVEEPDPSNKYLAWAYRLEHILGFEARGIQRVKRTEQTEKTTLGFLQIVLMWLSINTASQNVTLGSIGQSAFGLGFVDATLCSVFGAIVGIIPVAYTAGWGPWSGNRTLV